MRDHANQNSHSDGDFETLVDSASSRIVLSQLPLDMRSRSATLSRVLIADDHALIRGGLRALLETQPQLVVVGEAANGLDAIRQWQVSRPDLTVIDLSMPVLDGLDAMRAIRKLDPGARFITTSSFDGSLDLYQSFSAGANGYLPKSAEPAEWIAAVRRVLDGKTYLPADSAAKLAAWFGRGALTERELEILQLMTLGQSNKQVGRTLSISEGTVKTHVKRILYKLDASSRTEASAIAQRRGIVHL